MISDTFEDFNLPIKNLLVKISIGFIFVKIL